MGKKTFDGDNKNGQQEIQDEDFAELEESIANILDEYDVEYPSETQMMATIDAIRPHTPAKVTNVQLLSDKVFSLLKRSLDEFFRISSFYWLSNSLFFLIGLAVVFLSESNPYLTIMLLAPVPTVLGLVEIFKSRDVGMAELELTLKHTLQEVVLSKMVIVGGYNFVLNLLFTLIVPVFAEDVGLWKLILYWVTPFTVISAIAFLIASRFRSSYVVAPVMMIWMGIVFSLNTFPEAVERVEAVHVSFYMALTVLAFVLLIHQMIKLSRRGVSYEFNN